jgi:demethylmenaquinone methyltransferase/2-methoxy-6-polyprenyl-1,4-benzoquinol methylase
VRIISKSFKSPYILDVATGTADLAIAAMKTNPIKIDGIDISEGMLEIGRKKILKRGYSGIITLQRADSENIPFGENIFDVAMVAFGVRNFADPLKGLTEMRRILKVNGMIVVLEFSKPTAFPFRHIYNFYFRRILPLFGRLFSNDKSAYTYLPDSVSKFPDHENFLAMLQTAGFSHCSQVKLSGGIASIYTAIKKTVQ